MSDTATLPDLEAMDDQHTEEHTEPQQESGADAGRSASKRSRPKPAAKAADKPATITPETVREVLEVRGDLELTSEDTRALLVEVLKVEDDLAELTAAVICNPDAGEVLGKVQALRAQLAENPFAAAVEILTMDKSDRAVLWSFAQERGLVETKRVPANESKAATDLATALQHLSAEQLDAIAGAVALLER